jgi:hypothetical protein
LVGRPTSRDALSWRTPVLPKPPRRRTDRRAPSRAGLTPPAPASFPRSRPIGCDQDPAPTRAGGASCRRVHAPCRHADGGPGERGSPAHTPTGVAAPAVPTPVNLTCQGTSRSARGCRQRHLPLGTGSGRPRACWLPRPRLPPRHSASARSQASTRLRPASGSRFVPAQAPGIRLACTTE